MAPGAFAAAATRTLPRDAVSFTGRRGELTRLLGAIDSLAAGGGVVGIHAIDGMAGIGKTTFAVHAAHRLAPGFPDGQFFLPLHAHTPGQRPVGPADALASLLLTAGVTAPPPPRASGRCWSSFATWPKGPARLMRARSLACCSGWPATTRLPRPATMRRWTCSAASATGSARRTR
jgi:hypothetical protein